MTTLDRRDVLRMMALPLAALALAGRPGLLLAQEGAATDRRWWKEAVVYQIYPRSFMDSNGDGIGDLPGIVSKLDHIAALGVDVVWLCPHYPSPHVDNGHDVSDYRAVSPLFGTMADFDALVAGLKARGIRLIVDLGTASAGCVTGWKRPSPPWCRPPESTDVRSRACRTRLR